MALGNLIRRYRFDNGEMTQQQLADLCGVSRQTINAIERNKHPPSLEVAFRIAGVFGVAIENIFLYEPNSEGENPIGVIVDVTFRGAQAEVWIARTRRGRKPRHYERSAVVTRRPEPVMARFPADFARFPMRDAPDDGSKHIRNARSMENAVKDLHRFPVDAPASCV